MIMISIAFFQFRYIAFLTLFAYSLLVGYDYDTNMKTHEIVLLLMVVELTLEELFEVSFNF